MRELHNTPGVRGRRLGSACVSAADRHVHGRRQPTGATSSFLGSSGGAWGLVWGLAVVAGARPAAANGESGISLRDPLPELDLLRRWWLRTRTP